VKILQKGQKIVSPDARVVSAVVKGDSLSWKEQEWLDAAVIDGRALNSYDADSESIVPRSSAFQLWKWVNGGTEYKPERAALDLLLSVDASTAVFDGKFFEYFMSRWESLTRFDLFRHKHANSILGRYLRMSSAQIGMMPEWKNIDCAIVFGLKPVLQIDKNINADLSTVCFGRDYIYHVGKSQPGFDYFFREVDDVGRDILVLVEVRFSDPETIKQQLTKPDVMNKLALIPPQLQATSGSYNAVNYHRVYVLFIAMRKDVTKDLLSKPVTVSDDPRIVGIVLDRDMVKRILGDTLYYRAMFCANPFE